MIAVRAGAGTPDALRVRLADAGFTVLAGGSARPDVVVCGTSEAVSPAVPTVVVFVDPMAVRGAMRSGARGFLTCDVSTATLRRALPTVAAGGAFFGPGLLDAATATPLGRLTEREREVLDLLASGGSTSSVARFLAVAPKTVRNHVSVIAGKVGVHGLAGLRNLARDEGLGARPALPA